jgi:ribosomal protein S27AE
VAKGSVKDDAFVQGEHNRCPHCGGITRALPHDDLRWVCGACGGPRIPLDPGDELTERGVEALREANAARSAAVAYRLVSWACGFGALLGIGFGAVLAAYSLMAALGPAIVGALLVVLAIRFGSRSSERGKVARAAWERAWDAEVDDMLSEGTTSLTPSQIARKVKVPESEIEAIVARLSAEDRVRVDVGDDARLHVTSATHIGPAEPEEDVAEDADSPAKRAMERRP